MYSNTVLDYSSIVIHFLPPPVRKPNQFGRRCHQCGIQERTRDKLCVLRIFQQTLHLRRIIFYSILFLVISLCLNTAKMAVLPAHMLSGTRKPVKTVLGGPRKHTERFGCNSHIGQLNATTSALSLLFAYGIHMLMMSLVFFPACVYVHVCLCVLFVSLCVYFFFCTSSPPPSLFVSPNKKRCRKFGFILPFLKKKPRYARPIFTSSRLTIKGEVRRVPQLFHCRAPDFDKKPL